MNNIWRGLRIPVNQETIQVNAGSPFWNVNAPDVDMDVWSRSIVHVRTSMANGQPTWVANTAYDANYVVQHPAGSGNLYIPLESGGVTPAVVNWRRSSLGLAMVKNFREPTQDSIPLALGFVVNITSGEIYEYPINSNLLPSHAGSPFWT